MLFLSSVGQYASVAVHVDLCNKILKTHRHQRTDKYRCCIAILDLEALRLQLRLSLTPNILADSVPH